MAALAIKTENGWKPLWRMSPPERPPYHTSRPIDQKAAERWRDEQHKKLMRLHRLANPSTT